MSVVDFGDIDLNLFVSLLTLGDTFNKQVAESLTVHKISKPQFDVLYVISRSATKRETLTSLVQEHAFSKSNVSSILTRLEKRGLIRRVKDEHDKRITWLETTEQGEDFLAQIIPSYVKKIKDLLQAIPEEEKQKFFKYSENIRKNLLAYI